MQSRNTITARQVIALLIQAGALQSLNYNPAGTPPFSLTGTRLNLTTGDIQTPGLFASGSGGGVTVRGSVTADSFTLVDPAGNNITLDTAFTIPDSSGRSGAGLIRNGRRGIVWDNVAGGFNGFETLVLAKAPSSNSRAAVSVLASNSLQRALMYASNAAGSFYAAVEAQPGVLTLDAIGSGSAGVILSGLSSTSQLTLNATRINLNADSLGLWTNINSFATGWTQNSGQAKWRRVGDMVQVFTGRIRCTSARLAFQRVFTLPHAPNQLVTVSTYYSDSTVSPARVSTLGIDTVGDVDLQTTAAVNTDLVAFFEYPVT